MIKTGKDLLEKKTLRLEMIYPNGLSRNIKRFIIS